MNWSKWVLCQEDSSKKGALVLQTKVESFHHLIETIQEQSTLHDGEYVQIHKQLHETSAELLQTKNAAWHWKCYSNLTNKDQIHLAMVCYGQALSSGLYIEKGPGPKRKSSDVCVESSSSSTTFTRSSTQPYDKALCFFCQRNDDKPS